MTQLTTEDKAFIQTGSTMAVAAYGDRPPAGNWQLITDPRFRIVDQPSGFMARVYVNADTQQLWVAVAGTNGGSDVAAYPNAYIGWSTNTAQFQDALKFGSDLKNFLVDSEKFGGYSIATSGHSWGELFAQMFTHTFGWKGVGFDGVGAASVINSDGYRNELVKLNETAAGGSSFITCDTAGLSLGPIKFGGGGVGSLGLDIGGTRQCTVNVEWGLVSGVAGLAATVGAANPLVGYLLTKLISAAGLHSMEGKIDPAVQEGDFTVDPVAPAEPKPFSYNDGAGNSLQAKTDATGKVLKDESGNAIFTATVTSDTGNVSQVDFTADGRVLSMSDASTPTEGPSTDLFSATTNTTPVTTQSTGSDPTQSVSNTGNLIESDGTHSVSGVTGADVNTVTGNQQAANAIIGNDYRPGAAEVLHFDDWNVGIEVEPELYFDDWGVGVGAWANQQATGAIQWTPVDPLVLDLNGDGVKLTSFGEAPVLFDIDHDSTGSKEISGWVSKEDGIVVMDLNGNGKIDGIHETMSEYFNGAAGTGGEAGEKKYANGFAALKSLDSNADNQFTSADAAWANVKVWQDADHDGQTDAGELKTLTELGITGINLSPTTQSGLVNGGNEILATGTFTQNGSTKEALAARFIANPTGNTATLSASGTTVTAEDGQSTYVSSVATGETIDLAVKGVRNATGSSGNDILTGDVNANWLVGGQGSDTFNAGAGDDMLIVDAQDKQANIHAGAGFDMVQIVGSEGVTFNLAQAEVEVAVGGMGDDILIGGGRSSVFVRAGDGDDIVIGGAANDALNGENGADLIDGGAGNDIVRGGRGQDQLMGGSGDDLVEGGLDDDRLSGGAGNDILTGGQGDDALEGGEGIDIAEFSGSFADYRITRLSDTHYRVVDTRAGRDGADMLTNIEKLNFADVSAVDITLDNPFPVKDVLTITDRTGTKLIKVADLLANDRDWQGDALHISTISDIKGGTIVGTYNNATQEWTPTLTANGELQFTPDPAYTGVMSFKYKVADNDNTPGAQAIQIGTTNAAEMRGQVYLKTPDMPTDSLFAEEWYLNEINVLPVWNGNGGQSYTGKGVRIGQFEPGMPFAAGPEVYDYRHPDLQANADAAWMADPNAAIPQSFSQHATLVAGVMVGARNGEGAVGVAYDARLSGHYIQGTGLEIPALEAEITNALTKFKNYDVVNNSWGAATNFDINVVPVGTVEQGILDAVTQGRNGLGTAVVMAGGNDRQNGSNTNYNALTANRAVITTGAINAAGDISTLSIGQTPFSNPGASILVSAPGSNVASTSRVLTNDDGTVFGSDSSVTQGTSFAAPIVSGVVALMLEANPNLGWRDIQEILAITAKKVNDPNTDTVWNSANNWNGGGMHTSHDYGFGEVDARAAVRLAETWGAAHISDNERHLSNGEGTTAGGATLGLAIGDGSSMTRSLSIGAGLRVEHATVSLDLDHSNWGDLTIELVSPTGTVSKLVANPGASALNPGGDVGYGRFTFALDTTHDYGENAQGNWQLRISDRAGRGTGTLLGWKIDVYGKDWNEQPGLKTDTPDRVAGDAPIISAVGSDTYYYTDEFASAPGSQRGALTDTNGGRDTVNAAAVSSSSTINLNNGTTSTIAGRSLVLSGDIEEAIGGDGNDVLTGNALSNDLIGGRGNDTLVGGGGSDILDGGAGNDTMTGGAGAADYFVIRKAPNSVDVITDFSPGEFGEKVAFVGFPDLVDFSQVAVTQEGLDTRLVLGDGQSVLLKNVGPAQVSEQCFGFFSDTDAFSRYRNLIARTVGLVGTAGAENQLLPGADGDINVVLLGGDDVVGAITANDYLDGGDGNDTMWGDYPGYTPAAGDDWMEGGAGADALYGGDANDSIFGGSGNDYLAGEAGNDVLLGGTGDDYLNGGGGNDLIALEGDWGTVNGTEFGYYGTRVGGAGADVFKVMANGGGNASLSATGSQISAYNLIADFDPTQAGEIIDLTNLKWVRGFGDLSIQSMTINGTVFTRITASDGTNQLALNLRGLTGSALNAGHFKFNPNPGLVIGTNYNDTLTGDAGGNTLDGKAGADVMTGRTGDDIYIVDNVDDAVNELPDGGFDTVKANVSHTLVANAENLVLAGSGAINGSGNDLSNRITGNAAANVLDGGAGADSLLGGAGNDTYVVDSQADTVVEHAGEGTDTVQSSVSFTLGNEIEHLTLTGSGDINATGNSLNNQLVGNAGDNILDGAVGGDAMAGGAGDDTYLVDSIGDVVTEDDNEGIDTVYASVNATLGANVENLVLAYGAISGDGNALNNSLIGNASANTLNGGDGDDMLDGGTGSDTLAGGKGDDIYVADNVGDSVIESAGEGSDTVISSVDFDLSTHPNVENVVLTGTANINAVGNASDNRLVGNAGVNILTGGAGNDMLDGGAGEDALIGGQGNDTYVVDNLSDVVVELAGEGGDAVFASVNFTLGANVENLMLTGFGYISGTGNELDNVLTGNAGNNVLIGGDGADTLDGGAGADTLVGGVGNDTYKFAIGSRADTIVDGSGSDQLVFGTGIVASGVTASRTGSQVTLAVSATDNISFDETAPGQYAVETVSFADGTVWQMADIRQKVNSVPTGMLSIGGSATQNQVLTALNALADVDGLGTIGYQWQSSTSGMSWSDITGATAESFSLTEIQVDQQVRVVASYIDGHGTAESVASTATAVVANVNDAPTGEVSVAGSATQNQTLTAGNTLADLDGLGAIGYQWQSSTDGMSWSDITGAKAESFSFTETQVSQQVRVVASYTDGHGTQESEASSATAAVANINDVPTGDVAVAGVTMQNQTLVASNTLGDLDGLGTIGYQWQSSENGINWSNIYDAANATFVLGESQIGQQIRVVASYNDGHGTAESVASIATAAVANVNDITTGNVTVTGAAIQSQTLTANNTLGDLDGLGAIDYQWQSSTDGANWSNVSGATNAYFTLDEAQVGQQMRVVASYTDGHGTSESVTSDATAAVANVNDVTTGSVSVAGTATQNQTLTASNALGDLDGLGAISYQWQSSNGGGAWNDIVGASEDIFNLTEAQVGQQVRVVVSYTDGHGTVESVTSNATSVVANVNDAPIGGVSVAGTATQNQILTASNTLSDLDGLGAIGYQWQSSADGIVWNNIVGATAGSITPAESQVGQQMRVVASYTDGHGTTESLVSGATASIANTNDAPVVVTAIGSQLATEGNAFRLAVPSDAFADVDVDDTLTLSATLADGSILPFWLSFDAATRTFSGTPAFVDTGTIELKLTATDTTGAMASQTFGLAIDAVTGITLIGTAGNDTLTGSRRNDTLDGGAGRDSMVGGAGNDTFYVDNAGDTVVELAGEGNDAVISTVSLTLGANVENLTLAGAANLSGTGNALDNVLTGNTGANILNGGPGADTMIGGAGNDTYYVDNLGDVVTELSNEGADRVIVTISYALGENIENLTLSGTDAINGTGNELNNSIVGNTAANVLSGLGGNDSLTGGASDDTLLGGDGNDSLSAGDGNDVLDGGAGNDTLNGGLGADVMAGGTENDTYYVDNLGDVVSEFANEGTDRVISTVSYMLGDNVENLTLTGSEAINGSGNELNNTIVGNAAENVLSGLGGNDSLTGGDSNDMLLGGTGNDTLNGGLGADNMLGGADNDTYYVDSTGDSVTELAEEGTDRVISTISYTLGDNVENLTLSGPDSIDGTGNAQDNTLVGNAGANRLYGLDGNDRLTGNASDDLLDGGDGNDSLSTGDGNDTLLGGAGNDTLNGGAGDDSMTGGAGNDTYYVDSAGDSVTEMADEGTDRVISTINYTLGDNLENLTLSGTDSIDGTGNTLANTLVGNAGANRLYGLGGNDRLTGNASDDLLDGGDGNDSLSAGDGNDTLLGGAGNDTLNGGAGDDSMAGGVGNDTYYVDGAGDSVTELADEGTDRVISTIHYMVGDNLENLTLSGTEAINGIGNALANSLAGNAADNLLNGGEGNDTLNGAAGIDFLEGMAGNDTLSDAAGSGYFNGGAGADRLTGGVAADFFLGGAGNDTITSGDGDDIIVFNKGEGQDTFAAGGTGSDTVSLGGGIDYADLAFRKSSNDLVLKTGGTDQITFKNWYATTPSKPVLNLQIIAEAMADFDAGGSDPLRDQKVENFNFAGLAGAFDAARVANPGLTSWALTDALTQFQLAGSDTAALGGDLAYQYGKNGTLSGIGLTAAQQVIGDGSFGSQAQMLRPLAGLQEGAVRLS